MLLREDPLLIKRRAADIEGLRRRTARLARHLPLDDAGAVELLGSCLELADVLLRDLCGVARGADALEQQTAAWQRWWHRVFDDMPLACVEVDDDGLIVRANTEAARLFNTSSRQLRRKQLGLFAQDQEACAALLQAAALDGGASQAQRLTLRPRERSTIEVVATAVRSPQANPATICWMVSPPSTLRPSRPKTPRPNEAPAVDGRPG